MITHSCPVFELDFVLYNKAEALPIIPGDVAMLEKSNGMRKVAVVLKIHRNYVKVFLPKSNRQKRVNQKSLKFPADYFRNRKALCQECSRHLRFVVFKKEFLKSLPCFSLNEVMKKKISQMLSS